MCNQYIQVILKLLFVLCKNCQTSADLSIASQLPSMCLKNSDLQNKRTPKLGTPEFLYFRCHIEANCAEHADCQGARQGCNQLHEEHSSRSRLPGSGGGAGCPRRCRAVPKEPCACSLAGFTCLQVISCFPTFAKRADKFQFT